MNAHLRINEQQLTEFAKRIELIASHILEGSHFSKRGGEGIEFHSSLPYSEGEDIRRIDWKRYASTDRYYIQKFEREEKSSWTILWDSSSSMNYGSKPDFGRLFVGSILFLARVWGDSWTLLPDGDVSFEEAFKFILGNQAGLEPQQFEEIEGSRSSKLILISDFFFEEALLKSLVDRWEEEFKEIHLVQTLDLKELSFDFADVTRFEDMESTDRLTLDPRTARSAYMEALMQHQGFLKSLIPEGSGSFRRVLANADHVEKELMEFFEDL